MFIKRIYKEWRLLFWALVLFLIAQVFFMAKGIQNVPFFLYHMYSHAHPPKDSTAVYLIKTSTGYFNHKKLSNREEEMLMNPITYYANLKRDGEGVFETVKNRVESVADAQTISYLQKQLGNDSLSISAFPQCWGRYFRSVSGNKYDSAEVVKSYVYSKPPYHKSASDSLIFSIKLK